MTYPTRLIHTDAAIFGIPADVIDACERFCIVTWSDVYKDAHGVRPRWSLEGKTAADLDAMWDRTIEAADEAMDREETREIEAEIAFDAALDKLVALGAGNRRTAFRWMLDAEGISGEDMGYACYCLNLPYRMEAELKRLSGAV